MYFLSQNEFQRSLQRIKCKDCCSPVLKFNILKKVTIHAYFGSCQFPWFQACGVFANFGYFPVTFKLIDIKGILENFDSKITCYFTDNSNIDLFWLGGLRSSGAFLDGSMIRLIFGI